MLRVPNTGRLPTAQRFSSTDDNLWRPTRRAEGHYTKDKLSTRRGAVHSIGWLSRPSAAMPMLSDNLCHED